MMSCIPTLAAQRAFRPLRTSRQTARSIVARYDSWVEAAQVGALGPCAVELRQLLVAKAVAAERLVEIHRATSAIATGGATFVGSLTRLKARAASALPTISPSRSSAERQQQRQPSSPVSSRNYLSP